MAAGFCVLLSLWYVLPGSTWRVVWLDAADGGYRNLGDVPWLFDVLGGVRPATVLGVMLVTGVAGLGVMLGAWTRASTVVALIGFNSLIRINLHDGSAYDSMLTNLLLLLCFSGAGATWSVDAKRTIGRWTPSVQIAAWPRRMLILQLILCYWSTGVQKVSIHWLPGGGEAALYYILQDRMWQRFDMAWVAGVYPVTRFATAFTWLFEVLAPLWLVARWFQHTPEKKGRVRRMFNRLRVNHLFFWSGIGLHLGILAFMIVGPFSLVMLAYYPLLLAGGSRGGMTKYPSAE